MLEGMRLFILSITTERSILRDVSWKASDMRVGELIKLQFTDQAEIDKISKTAVNPSPQREKDWQAGNTHERHGGVTEIHCYRGFDGPNIFYDGHGGSS